MLLQGFNNEILSWVFLALQGRPANGWDYLSSINGLLSSKWDEAEKYICNPLSGQIPLECLSTKTLSGRALPISRRLLTKSGPLVLSETHLVKMRANLAYEDKDDFASPGYQSVPPLFAIFHSLEPALHAKYMKTNSWFFLVQCQM